MMRTYSEVELLKLQLAEETKEKYALYKIIKELNGLVLTEGYKNISEAVGKSS